jgi:O-antigen/teichoic acid export membrane protein
MAADLLSACARHVAGIASGLIMVPLIVHFLGSEGLGAWALLGTTGFLLGLSDLGLSIAVQRATARSDEAATRRLVGLTNLVVLVVCPCMSAAAYFLLFRLPSASAALQADVDRAAPLALVAGLAGSLGAPLRAFLMMRGAFGPLAWARAAASAVQVGVTALWLMITPSLAAPSAGLLANLTVETLLLARASRRLDPLLDLRPRWPSERSEVRDAFRQGAAALAINVGVAAGTRADVLILTAFVPLSAIGAYQVGSRAIDQIFALAKQVSGWLLHRLGDRDSRPGALRLGTAVLGGMVSSGVAALALDGSALLVAWAGPIGRDRIVTVAVGLLGTAAIIAAAEEVAAAALTVSGATTWHVARPMIAGQSLNVAVSILGVRYFGAWAVAGGTVCGNLLFAVLVWSRARELVNWRLSEVLWALAPMVAGALVSLGAGVVLAPLAARGPLLSAIVCCGVGGLGTAAALLSWWWRGLVTGPVPVPATGDGPQG